VSEHVGDAISFLGPGSHSVSSAVQKPPLSFIVWLVVSDSQLVLVASNMFSNIEGSPVGHFALDLELDSILVDWLWILEPKLINVPFLVELIMAWPPYEVSLVLVDSSMYIHAEFGVILELVTLPIDPLRVVSNPFSENDS